MADLYLDRRQVSVRNRQTRRCAVQAVHRCVEQYVSHAKPILGLQAHMSDLKRMKRHYEMLGELIALLFAFPYPFRLKKATSARLQFEARGRVSSEVVRTWGNS